MKEVSVWRCSKCRAVYSSSCGWYRYRCEECDEVCKQHFMAALSTDDALGLLASLQREALQ